MRTDGLRRNRSGWNRLNHRKVAGQVRPAAGIAVDRRLVERRHVDVGSHVFSQHAIQSVAKVDTLAVERPGRFQDDLQSFPQFDHGALTAAWITSKMLAILLWRIDTHRNSDVGHVKLKYLIGMRSHDVLGSFARRRLDEFLEQRRSQTLSGARAFPRESVSQSGCRSFGTRQQAGRQSRP